MEFIYWYILLYEYIDKMLKELSTKMGGLVTTPASRYLFNTDPVCKKLCEDQGQLFHHWVAKLQYLSKHTRQDIQTAVAFLCTQVRELDTDDYQKLTKVMQYLRNTKNMTLMIELDEEAKWWVWAHMQYTQTWKVTQGYTWHLEKEPHTWPHVNKN